MFLRSRTKDHKIMDGRRIIFAVLTGGKRPGFIFPGRFFALVAVKV